jgi:8-oxo-dGTP pyrophosphatase MutT (NUDIX family)
VEGEADIFELIEQNGVQTTCNFGYPTMSSALNDITIWFGQRALWLGSKPAGQRYDYTHAQAMADLPTLRARHLAAVENPHNVPPIQVLCTSPAAQKSLLEAYTALFVPIHTGGGIVRQGNTLLAINRKGKWDLPKGKIDPGEDSLQAAMREIEEETGVTGLQLQEPLPCTWHIYPEKGEMVLKTGWWYAFATKYDGPLLPQTEEDITEVMWQSMAELAPDTLDTYPAIRQLLQAYLRRFPVS